jgi:hypothetical protein
MPRNRQRDKRFSALKQGKRGRDNTNVQ